MTISVIIICRNAHPFLQNCLTSIWQQHLSPAEIIVVDGHSQDGSFEWLQTQHNVTVYRQQGMGLANARNQGIQAATGNCIAFLDADDYWFPTKLNQQAATLQQQPTLQAITGHLQKSDDSHQTPWVAMTPSGFLFRKAVFDEYGLFDEQWTVAADHAWFIRAIRQGLPYAVLPDVLLRKGIHPNSLSAMHRNLYRTEMLAIMRQSNTIH